MTEAPPRKRRLKKVVTESTEVIETTSESKAPRKRRSKADIAAASQATEAMFSTPDQNKPAEKDAADTEIEQMVSAMPDMDQPFRKIQDRLYSVKDPLAVYAELENWLELQDALHPGALQDAMNRSEKNALKAHQLYVVAQLDFARFEAEAEPIIEAMRDAAYRELQREKAAGIRNKSITDADVVGRIAAKYPDEWHKVTLRKKRAEGTLSQLKMLSRLCEQRCFSIGTMNNAGRRS